ncbi:hypothetical protein [Longimicrobium sp.]|uniref:hypothetical protein n=1 Tax=Longimicrobium sp. TaxID=2029185 RepID=UPI003B3B5CAA
MAEAVGAVIVIGEDVDAFGGPIMSSIERTAGFTDVVSTSDWKLPQTSLVLISSYGTQFEFIGLVHRSAPVATGKRRVRVSDLEPFDQPVGVDEILRRIPERFRRPFEDAINSGSAVPPATWAHVLDALIAIRPDLHPVVERLRRLATPKRVSGEAQAVIAQERDAVNLALRASGFDPARLVDVDPDVDGTAPFLTGLREASITEDQAIGHDAGVFGSGWRMLDRYQVGTAVFEQEGTRLTVMNVNRTKVEHTLGVDLLYYHHQYRSYVLVQYKSMRKKGKVLGYRPGGKSYEREMERMRRFMREHPPTPSAAERHSYRLHPGLFYLKLCSSIVLEPHSTKMIGGMYLPLDYWDVLLESGEVQGPRGGRIVTFENAGRYLTNSHFVDLLQAGWIGSRLEHTEAVTQLVNTAVDGDRSLIVAANMPTGRPRPAVRRRKGR